jgi:hypothetical protein
MPSDYKWFSGSVAELSCSFFCSGKESKGSVHLRLETEQCQRPCLAIAIGTGTILLGKLCSADPV